MNTKISLYRHHLQPRKIAQILDNIVKVKFVLDIPTWFLFLFLLFYVAFYPYFCTTTKPPYPQNEDEAPFFNVKIILLKLLFVLYFK